MEITSVIIGFFVGGIIASIISHLFHKTKNVSKKIYEELALKYNEVDKNCRLFEDKTHTLQGINNDLANKLTIKENKMTEFQTKEALLEERLTHYKSTLDKLELELNSEIDENNSLQNQLNLHFQKVSELTANNISISDNLQKQISLNDKLTKQMDEQTTKITQLTAQVSNLTANNIALNEKLSNQKIEVEALLKTAHLQFEKIANKLLEEKTEKFTASNKTNIEILLKPLKEDINKFKEKIETTHTEETKQRSSLEERIKGLIEQTNKISTEANNLAAALKGNAQKRGNWGEMILERILESSGLTKGREYFVQQSIKDEAGQHKRLDVIVNLPDNRVIIIDSKVSLIDYDHYFTSEDIEKQKGFLAEHLKATKLHIDQLSEKKYDNVENSLDFIMMFIPIEPAYLLAIQNDPDLWFYAYSKRILLVSPTTLIACLKLFLDLWRRDTQNKNAKEIVKKGEALYEKFIGFTTSFEEIGNSLKTSQEKYDKALGQLNKGRGNLINQAIQLKNLGLKSDKKISENLSSPFESESEFENDNHLSDL